MKIDLHIHTKYSPCSNMEPELVVKQAKYKGLDAVAITDHNTIEGFRKIQDNEEILVIPGIEILTASGDVIGLFIEEEIKKRLPLEETVDRIKELGGLVIIPHPFDNTRNSVDRKIKNIKPNAIEIFNPRVSLEYFNKKAREYAKNNKVIGVVGSDAHFINEIGNTHIETKNRNIYTCIKKGYFKNYGSYSDPIGCLRSRMEIFDRKVNDIKLTLTNLY